MFEVQKSFPINAKVKWYSKRKRLFAEGVITKIIISKYSTRVQVLGYYANRPRVKKVSFTVNDYKNPFLSVEI